MCEWLSYGDWCDVKLLCGDRSFDAHRVVLASVSIFLRKVLLSCPTNESPSYIILPDFDKDAMSAVLYYIYHGEVILQKHKIGMFFEIIKAMEIYIDYDFLSTKLEETQNMNSCLVTSQKDVNILDLNSTQCFNNPVINIKKKPDIANVHYSLKNIDAHERRMRYQDNMNEQCHNTFGDFKSPFTDRQRNSFLRDLFIETYPRNGNVNGQTKSVLAISNECYRSPGSVLFTNANAEHLSAGDTVVEKYKNTVKIPFYSPTYRPEHLNNFTHSQNLMQNYLQTKDEIVNLRSFYGYTNTITNTDLQGNLPLLHTKMLSENAPNTHTTNLSCFTQSDAGVASVELENQTVLTKSSMLISLATNFGKEYSKSKTISKATISNHVLENPWRPRLPVDTKPFRRKCKGSNEISVLPDKVGEINIISDNNNNCETDPVAPNVRLPVVKNEFKCHTCSQMFLTSESLSTHMRRHSTSARYACNECGKTFSQLRNFKYHMSIHRGTREFAATCTVCGKYFNDRGYLSSHMKIHRNRKEYKCTQCPKSFNQRVAYNMHVRIHTGVKPHVCNECGKAFSRKMLLKQHQRTHSGERPYACPHCDKRFADRSNMTLHLRLHTGGYHEAGIKPFSCTLCPKSFTKKHHLKSHLNFHTGSKPYSCPRCNLAFTQSSNMRTHYKKCTAPLSNEASETTVSTK